MQPTRSIASGSSARHFRILTAVDFGVARDQLGELRGRLQVGIQWGTQVTLRGCSHLISLIYCSALPVAYSAHSSDAWKDFAVLILEGAYEATLCAAILNAQVTGNNTVFLTLLGDQGSWIIDAIDRALQIHARSDLDIRIVSFRRPHPGVEHLTRHGKRSEGTG